MMAGSNASVSRRMTAIAALLWLTARSANAIQPHSNDWATQAFFFSWNSPNTVLPIPITAQCETLNVHWGREGGTGPDPIPPYYLRIYSTAVNDTVDSFQLVNAGTMASTQLQIPFPPGTMYVICMTDSVGASGGCQDLYTVYPSPTNQTCTGFTPPAKVLGMRGISLATQGSFSRWSWPASCTDLQLEPIDDGNGGIKGTPPYTLTVAPAIRPPLNITFDQSVKWTIALAHGATFFLSVSDANGVTWTDGPIHAGAGDKSCLATAPDSGLSAPTTIGTAIGSFFLGGILAVLVFWLVVRRHRNQRPSYHFDMPHPSPLDSMSPQRVSSHPTLTPLPLGGNTEFHSYSVLDNSVESRYRKRPNNYGPLDSHDSATRQRTPDGRSSPPGSSIPLRTTRRNSTSSVSSPTTVNQSSSPPMPGTAPVHEVFVVHHDAGAPPPVTVYALPGSRVTELPPGYDFGGSRSPENTTRSPPQLTLMGDHPSPESPTPNLYFPRDHKASYAPRSGPPTSFSPPLDPHSPNISPSDERARAATSNRLLPSTAHLHAPVPIKQMPDPPTSNTSRTRGPRPMSPPDTTEQEIWK